MGRDSRSNKVGYYIRAKLYKSEINDEEERIIKRDFTNPIVFYAKDNIDFKTMQSITGAVYNRTLMEGYIETVDLQKNEIKRLDTVEYDGDRYNVDDVVFIDKNQQKEISKRVQLKTIIKLGRVIDD